MKKVVFVREDSLLCPRKWFFFILLADDASQNNKNMENMIMPRKMRIKMMLSKIGDDIETRFGKQLSFVVEHVSLNKFLKKTSVACASMCF